jgi:microsomal dipeptidase-like Zn-dependent dipeptidase
VIPKLNRAARLASIALAIGADYFRYSRRPFEKPFTQTENGGVEDEGLSKTFVVAFNNISAMPLFTQALVSRGFADRDIKKMLGENAMRY